MNTSGSNLPSINETDKDRLDSLLFPDVLTLDLVSALAGDRPLTKAEALLLDRRKAALGNRFYSDLLYAITHQHFEADIAKTLWKEIIRHKYEMSAALDYLSNITGDILSTTLISEEHNCRLTHRNISTILIYIFYFKKSFITRFSVFGTVLADTP